MALIDTAYAYYLTTYGNRSSTRYDTHKKSELRDVYNQMVKVNKNSPLYKIKNKGEVVKFAIDIKEGAQHIRNVVSSISGSEDIMKALQKKIATSSQEDVVSAKYIGQDDANENIETFDIEVQQLAKSQVNIGNFLNKNQRYLTPGEYSFDLENASSGYEFQFNVNPEDTNYGIQNKLANLITNANIGLTASVIEDNSGQSALKIESLHTGLENENHTLFQISAGEKPNSSVAIETLGIDHIEQEAQNAFFLLNGKSHIAHSNAFTINNEFELQLKNISQNGQTATIGFKPNTQAVLENIQNLTNAYNSIINTTAKYSETQSQGHKLQHQISSIANFYGDELASIGLNKEDDNSLTIDTETLTDAIESENPSERLSVLNNFKNLLDKRASVAVLNPMEYVNKVVVAYKNPYKALTAPYMTSIYAGMMLDKSC